MIPRRASVTCDSVSARFAPGSTDRPNPRPVLDGLITATAVVHGITLATRDTNDFEGVGADLFNPLEGWSVPARFKSGRGGRRKRVTHQPS